MGMCSELEFGHFGERRGKRWLESGTGPAGFITSRGKPGYANNPAVPATGFGQGASHDGQPKRPAPQALEGTRGATRPTPQSHPDLTGHRGSWISDWPVNWPKVPCSWPVIGSLFGSFGPEGSWSM